MIRALLTIALCLLAIGVSAQTDSSSAKYRPLPDTLEKLDLIDIANSILHKRARSVNDRDEKKLYFSFLPISSSAIASAGQTLVASTTAGFYLGSPRTTYLSSINFTPYLNFQGRYGLPIRSSIWLKDNTFNIQGDTRVLVYPQYTWGLGGGQPDDHKFLVDYVYVRFYQSVVKQITPYFFAGLGYNLDYYFGVNSDNGSNTTLSQFTNYNFGTKNNENSFSSGPTINLLYDTRNNSINPLPGWYGNIIYRLSAAKLGSIDNWQSLYVDVRKYLSLAKTPSGPKNMLAFWGYYWTTLTPGSPYLNLPSIGNDPYQRSGRGVEQNRYRGESLIYLETEYRCDITDNGLFGFVAFANVNSASQPNSRQFRYFNPAGGVGLRIKFNKKTDTNIGIDYGVSKNYSSITINLGEAF
jgi:energy-coupling factor transporter transmembrane protein EcfT